MILRVEQVLVSAYKTGAIDVISIKGKVSNNRQRICMLRKNSCVCFGYFFVSNNNKSKSKRSTGVNIIWAG